MDSTDLIQKLYIRILKFISIKPRTEGETGDRISEYLYKFKDMSISEKDSIKRVLIAQLREENLINDADYVRDYINSLLLSTKAKNPNSIKQFLLKKHLPIVAIETILSSMDSEYQKKAVFELAKKKLRSYSKYPKSQIKPRLMSFLLSKGFDYDTVSDVIGDLIV